MRALARRIAASPPLQAVLVALVVLAIHLPLLGRNGLSATEGHRAIPGWEMLDTGDPLLPHLFERPYLRKPPGVAWAVAATGAILGRTELSARLVSVAATLAMALLALAYTTRWLGAPWGLAAGLAQALLPMYWPPARSIEIEALNNLATMAAVLALIDLALHARRAARWSPALLGAGLVGLAAVKGPAGLPALAGAALACAITTRSARTLLRPRILAPLAIATIAIAALSIAIALRLDRAGADAVTQSIGEFIWGGAEPLAERLRSVLLLAPAALLAGLPLTVALVVPWIRPARLDDPVLARTLALTWLLTIAILMALGVDNHRYAMVAMVTLAPLAAIAIRAARAAPTRLDRLLLINRPAIWAAALLTGAAVFVVVFEDGRARRSGRDAGIALAAHLPDGALVAADHLVEARPEVLLYARRAAARDGRAVEVRWIDHTRAAALLRPGDFIVVRTDDRSNEAATLGAVSLETISAGAVHEYTFELRRVTEP